MSDLRLQIEQLHAQFEAFAEDYKQRLDELFVHVSSHVEQGELEIDPEDAILDDVDDTIPPNSAQPNPPAVKAEVWSGYDRTRMALYFVSHDVVGGGALMPVPRPSARKDGFPRKRGSSGYIGINADANPDRWRVVIPIKDGSVALHLGYCDKTDMHDGLCRQERVYSAHVDAYPDRYQ